jgi:hypothetical protein
MSSIWSGAKAAMAVMTLALVINLTVPAPPAQAGLLGGALGGAIVGGIIGGRKGARAGAVVGGIAGAIRR